MLTREKILETLRQLVLADGTNVVQTGLIEAIEITETPRGYAVVVTVLADPAKATAFEPLRLKIENMLSGMATVTEAKVILTAHKVAPRFKGNRPVKQAVDGVKHVIVVGSGKGGVGKSTTALNIALALKASGQTVGLLDADIYGPSIPRMTGVTGKPQTNENKKFIPLERFGISLMSIGFLVAEDAAMVWRGPLVHGAITQLLRDVAWNANQALDFLIIDLPPGTGDAQLTIAQSVPLAGAIIVSTPQDIALIDARKAIAMFGRVDVPILGIIENMSYFLCPHCGERSDIFSHGGAMKEALHLKVPFLGSVPLSLPMREGSDLGRPLILEEKSGETAALFAAMAQKIVQGVAGKV